MNNNYYKSIIIIADVPDGVDFSGGSTVMFAEVSGTSTVEGCVNVTIVDDDNFEGDQNVRVILDSGTQLPSTLIISNNDNSSVQLVITDDEGKLKVAYDCVTYGKCFKIDDSLSLYSLPAIIN